MPRQCGCRDLDGALHDLEEARGGFQKIADRDSDNLEARRDLGDIYKNRAKLLDESHRSTEAADAYRKALAIYQEFARTDPTNGENRQSLDDVSARIASLERARHR